MSSRLIPRSRGNGLNRRNDAVGVGGQRQIGHASTPPNSLKRSAFPSITGSAASGPTFHGARARRLPVAEQDGNHCLSLGPSVGRSIRIGCDRVADTRHGGCAAIDRSWRVFTAGFELPCGSSRQDEAGTSGSETCSTSTPPTARQARTIGVGVVPENSALQERRHRVPCYHRATKARSGLRQASRRRRRSRARDERKGARTNIGGEGQARCDRKRDSGVVRQVVVPLPPTERREAASEVEQALRQNEGRASSLTRSTRDLLALQDLQQKIVGGSPDASHGVSRKLSGKMARV